MTTTKLMQVALTKYKDRIRSDTWQAPSAEEEQIIALTAQISDLRKETSNHAEREKGKKSTSKKGNDGKKANKAKIAEKYAWKLVPPARGEPTTKEVNKKTYHFCPHHNNESGAWVIHHPSKCDRREVKNKAKHLQKKRS